MTAHELLNELAMSSSFKNHLIVEGETDQRLLQQALPKTTQVNVVPAGNSEAALEVAKAYGSHAAHHKIHVVVFVDRDYQVALNEVDKIPGVVVTELRDIECMMFDSICYDRIADEYMSAEKLRKIGMDRQTIKQHLINLAAEFGCLRFTSQKLKWNLSLSSINFEKFTILEKFSLDRGACINHVNGHQSCRPAGGRAAAPLKRISGNDFILALQEAKKCKAINHPLLRARGHDLMALFCLVLKKRLGNRMAQDLSVELLEKTFRIGYPEILKATRTFKRLIKAVNPTPINSSV